MIAIPAFFPERLRRAAVTVSARRGESLFHQGDAVKGIYRIGAGQVELVRYAPNGDRIILHRALPGEFVAEASLAVPAYHCSAVCSTDVEALLFPAPEFLSCLRDVPDFAAMWSMELANSLRVLRMRCERSQLKSARDRIVHFLLTEPVDTVGAVSIPGSLSAWADELGLARETLYRTLARLAREGMVERRGSRVKLLRNPASTHRSRDKADV